MTKDDILNEEIEQEHKESEKRREKFQNDVDSLINEIKTSQDAKGSYFKEVLEGKHPGKKLVQQRIVIQFAEVIDYDKSKLVYEETEEDEKANRQYLQSCSTKIARLHFNLQMRFKSTKDFLLKNFTCIAEIMQVHRCRM